MTLLYSIIVISSWTVYHSLLPSMSSLFQSCFFLLSFVLLILLFSIAMSSWTFFSQFLFDTFILLPFFFVLGHTYFPPFSTHPYLFSHLFISVFGHFLLRLIYSFSVLLFCCRFFSWAFLIRLSYHAPFLFVSYHIFLTLHVVVFIPVVICLLLSFHIPCHYRYLLYTCVYHCLKLFYCVFLWKL